MSILRVAQKPYNTNGLFILDERGKVEMTKAEKEKFVNMDSKKAIKLLEALPPSELDYDVVLILGRAYNNNLQLAKAKEVMLTVQVSGEKDPVWNYRMGYACYYLDQYEEALAYLENAKAMGRGEWADELLPDCKYKIALKREQAHNEECQPEKRDVLPIQEVVSTVRNNPWISVCFNIESLIPFSIGEKMQDLCDEAYMNGYNWAAFLNYYLSEYEPDILVGMDADPEAGSYVAYYDLTDENEKRAEKFVRLIKHLLENEEDIYDELRLNKDKIEWD